MLEQFSEVWSTLGTILSAIPADVTTAVTFVLCSIGVIAMLRSL